MRNRPCSRVACRHNATVTLTYVYADQVAVIGPLSFQVEPHSYDLCDEHASRLVVPKGWEILRHVPLTYDL